VRRQPTDDCAGWFAAHDETLTETQREYLVALRALAESWPAKQLAQSSSVAIAGDTLMAYVDIRDPEGLIVATLQAHLEGRTLWLGWETSGHVAAQTPASAGKTPVLVAAAASRCAAAATWMLDQLDRPIERREWHEGGRRAHAAWRLADTGTPLARADARHRREAPRRSPDHVLTFTPLRAVRSSHEIILSRAGETCLRRRGEHEAWEFVAGDDAPMALADVPRYWLLPLLKHAPDDLLAAIGHGPRLPLQELVEIALSSESRYLQEQAIPWLFALDLAPEGSLADAADHALRERHAGLRARQRLARWRHGHGSTR